jgi:hypothetical protein
MGERQRSIRISEEGIQGRCPPCLLGHRRETRKSAVPKRHTSLNHHSSQPGRRAHQADQSLPRARRTSAPTNGSWKSFTSGTWPTRLRWTGPGGVFSRTTSRPSPTEPDPSRSSRRRRSRGTPKDPRGTPKHPPRRRHRPRLAAGPPGRRRRLPRPRLLPRPLLRPPPPAQVGLQPRPRLRRLPRAQLCPLPQPRSKAPRSAGCEGPRRARSPT